MRCRTLLATPALVLSLAALAGCGAPPPPATAATAPVATVTPAPIAPAPAPVDPGAAAPAPDDASLGQLDFPVTGSADCQRHFREGMLALHSFLYDQAHV